jgi:dihydroorotase
LSRRLETAFAALFTELVMSGELELAIVVERMSAGAALYDLPTPRIAVGEVANVCLVDLDARFEVGDDGYASRSTNSCFHGRSLYGRVLLTLAAGAVAFRRPMLVDHPAGRPSATAVLHGGLSGRGRGSGPQA